MCCWLLGEAGMVMMALEGLERVLQVEESRETARREQLENGELAGDDGNRSPFFNSASLIEKALEKHNSSAVAKRANRIWKQHFVSRALCKKTFSKHRTSDATFCVKCKCYVCSACDCKMYHLSYQEELWAVNEEETEAKKSAKKSKKQKKKEKQKQKKAKQQVQPQTPDTKAREMNVARSRSSTVTSVSDTGSAGLSTSFSPQQVRSTPLNEVSLLAPIASSTDKRKEDGSENGSLSPDSEGKASPSNCWMN